MPIMSIGSDQVFDARLRGSTSNSRRMAEKGARHGAIRLAAALHRRDDAEICGAGAFRRSLMLTVGCSASHQQKPLTPPEVTPAGVSTRVNIPADLNVNPAETVVGAAAANRAGPPPTPVPAPAGPALQPPSQTVVPPSAIFSLPDAFPFGPRGPGAAATVADRRAVAGDLLSVRRDHFWFAEQSALAIVAGRNRPSAGPRADRLLAVLAADRPFWPIRGRFLNVCAGRTGQRRIYLGQRRRYSQLRRDRTWFTVDADRFWSDERPLWTGRGARTHRGTSTDSGSADCRIRCQFSVSRLAFGAGVAASARGCGAVRQSILDDTTARRIGGVALKEDVLRADVQWSETQEALILARQGEFNAVARLNNAMGRNASWPLEILDLNLEPTMSASLAQLLEMAAAERRRSHLSARRRRRPNKVRSRHAASSSRIFSRGRPPAGPTARMWCPAGRKEQGCIWRCRSTPAAATRERRKPPMRTWTPHWPMPRPSSTTSASK